MVSVNDARGVVATCLERIRSKYLRKGKEDAWTDATRAEFVNAFRRVPVEMLSAIVDEILLNPPCDDRGRGVNYLPDPSDVITVARRMTEEGEGDTVAVAVAEIWREIGATGYVGTPKLSPLAQAIVEGMGGWYSLCTEPAVQGVLQGQMMALGREIVQREKQKPLFAPNSDGNGLRLPSGNGRPDRERIGRQ